MTPRKRRTDAPVWLTPRTEMAETFSGGNLWIGQNTADASASAAESRARDGGPGSLRKSDFQVCLEHRPGWVRSCDSPRSVGETVYCAAGEGTIVGIHGKTGDGSRLLQVRLADPKASPFFAAASNVLVKPR